MPIPATLVCIPIKVDLCSRICSELGFRHNSIRTGSEGEAGNPPSTKEEKMTAATYPRGWNQDRVRRVVEYYESQSDEEPAAEIEAALESTTMEVPVALVPALRQLIAKRKLARARSTKTHKTTLPPASRAQRRS